MTICASYESLFAGKDYLVLWTHPDGFSYELKKVHLNFIQQFFRWAFGCYSETHLSVFKKHCEQHLFPADTDLSLITLVEKVRAKIFPQGVDPREEAERLKSDPEYILSLLNETDKSALTAASEALFAIRENVKTELRDKPSWWLSPAGDKEVKKREQAVFNALVGNPVNRNTPIPFSPTLKEASPSLKENPSFLQGAIQKFTPIPYPYTPINKNKALVKIALEFCGNYLRDCPTFQDDEEMARFAIYPRDSDGLPPRAFAATYFSPRLKADRAFILQLAQEQGLVIYYAAKDWQEGVSSSDPGFRDDKEVALVAVKQNPAVYKHLSKRLQEDEEVKALLPQPT